MQLPFCLATACRIQMQTACPPMVTCPGQLGSRHHGDSTSSGGHLSALQRHDAPCSTAQRTVKASTDSSSRHLAAKLALPASAMRLRHKLHCSALPYMVRGGHYSCMQRNHGEQALADCA
jgi:hypothetical protein